MKKITKFKDIHTGKRCFIIGNGPSLLKLDLSKLKNEITIGCNRIYKTNLIKPTYYCIEDVQMMLETKDEIRKFLPDDTIKFIPKQFAYLFRNVKNVYPVNFIYNSRIKAFSGDFAKVCYLGLTVTYMMLQLAYYLNCKEIYCIGMDGPPSNTSTDHFYQEDGKANKINPRIEDAYNRLKFAEAIFKLRKNITIYNATPNPRKQIFTPIDYEEVFLN